MNKLPLVSTIPRSVLHCSNCWVLFRDKISVIDLSTLCWKVSRARTAQGNTKTWSCISNSQHIIKPPPWLSEVEGSRFLIQFLLINITVSLHNKRLKKKNLSTSRDKLTTTEVNLFRAREVATLRILFGNLLVASSLPEGFLILFHNTNTFKGEASAPGSLHGQHSTYGWNA